MDDEDLARTVIAGFHADIPVQITVLKNYLAAGELTGVMRQAHGIKGASANVGGDRLCETAASIETAANAGDLNAVAALVGDLEAKFGELIKEFSRCNMIS